MKNLKVWIDQILEKILQENDHYHTGKLKWLLKFKKYKDSKEEALAIQSHNKLAFDSEHNPIIIDNVLSSSTPSESISVKKTTRRKKKKFLSFLSKGRGA